MSRRIIFAVAMSALAANEALLAQQPEPLASCVAVTPAAEPAEVERTSVYVPMKDGTRLAVDVYLPKGLSGKRLPTVFVATRYWRGGEGQPLGPAEKYWIGRGYAYVYADVRGTGASYGQWFYPWSPTEVEDLGGVVSWIARQPWSDGQVGSIGTSYTGNTAQLVGAAGLPAVKAVVPRFIDFDAYADLVYPGGVVNEMLIRDWGKMVYAMDMNKVPGAPAGVRRVDADTAGKLIEGAVLDHQQNPPLYSSMDGIIFRDDVVPAYGNATNDMVGTYRYRDAIEKARVPIFGWGSWLDAGTSQGVVNRFVNWSNPQIAVIGPWSHGGGNHASPFLPTATPTAPSSAVQSDQAACFFDQYLKGKSNRMQGKQLIYYTLGEDKWKSTTAWPITGTRNQRWFLEAGGKLGAAKGTGGSDSYKVDFAVSTGTKNRWYTQLGGGDVIYEERSGQDRRMLAYTSAPLAEDTEITGQGVISLDVTSTATDGNFFVYLEDVGPDGKSTYVTEGMLRAIHRKLSTEPAAYRTTYPYRTYSKKDAQPLLPGKPATLTFQLLPTSVLFKKGHRIRIALAGADKDTFQRLPATGDVTWTVQRGKSYVDLPVVPR